MSTTVTDYELSIPGKFVAPFRLSLVDELNSDADWIKEQGDHVLEVYTADDPLSAERRHGSPSEREDAEKTAKQLDVRLADLMGPVRSLADDYAMFEQLARSASWPGQDLTVRGSFETLHGALEATIRRATRDLVAECEYSPLAGGQIIHRSSAAIWAAEQIERLSTEHADTTGGDA